jgi:hypothetical protein
VNLRSHSQPLPDRVHRHRRLSPQPLDLHRLLSSLASERSVDKASPRISQKETKATKSSTHFVSFVSFCSIQLLTCCRRRKRSFRPKISFAPQELDDSCGRNPRLKRCICSAWSLRERTERRLQSAGRLGSEGALKFSNADLQCQRSCGINPAPLDLGLGAKHRRNRGLLSVVPAGTSECASYCSLEWVRRVAGHCRRVARTTRFSRHR